MSEQALLWGVFGLLIIIMLAVDLRINRKAHKVSFRQVLICSIIWAALALFFLLASVMEMFIYLKFGISFILFFVGTKMIAGVSGFPVPITVSLTVIIISLTIAVFASVMFGRNRRQQALENI